MANTLKVKRSATPSKVPTTSDLQLGEIAVNTYDGVMYIKKDNGTASIVQVGGGSGSGDVVGPSSATDNAVARFDTTTGKLIQNSVVTIDDNGNTAGVNAVTFDTTPSTVPTAEGSLYWDSADGNQTLSLVMAGGTATQQIGEEIYFRIKASSAITNGQAVMFTGTVGASGALTGAPASGLTDATSTYFMGIATQDIALNGWGYVTQFGLIRGIDTTGGAEAWVDGQILYYNPAVAGGLTKTVPTAPAAKIQAAVVVNAASGGSGSLFVRPTINVSLEDLNDVETASATTNDLLQYDGSKWLHKAPSTVTGVGSALTLTTGRTIGITGDLTYTSPSFDGSGNVTAAGTLATVNSNVGSFTNASITVNAKGLVTAVSSGTAPVTSVTGTSPIASSGGATPAISISQATTSTNGYLSSTDWNTFNNKTSNTGTVTSVAMTVPTGLSVSGTPITTSGTLAVTLTAGYSIPTTASQTNWDSAYTDRLKWDGGSTGLVAATGRTSLGGTTVGQNFFTLANPTAITFPRINADNTVSALDAATFRTAIGAGTSSTTGTVTSVAALTLGTTGTDLSSTVATGTTTPVITLNVPTASATNRGALSAADWTTFNNKQPAGSYVTVGGALGTPSSGTLTNCTFPTLNQNTTGNAATATTATNQSGGSVSATTIENSGGAKLVVQNSQDGGTGRGLYMWNASDPNWVIYMAQAGAGKSASGATAPSGFDGRTGHAIRYRVASSTNQIGFLWENASEIALMQLQPNTGNLYIAGTYNGAGTGLTGTAASLSIGGSSASCTGNAATATNAVNLSTDRTNWSTNGTVNAVVGQLAWKNYGNSHTIFDASNSTTPTGAACSNTTPSVAWSATHPTLMGYNGTNTYGVRVYISNTSEACTGNAATATTATYLSGAGQTNFIVFKIGTTTDINNANDTGSFSVRGDATYPASVSFHRAGVYAINMGLSTSNEFVIGGWSANANCFRLTGAGAGTFLSTCTATQFNGSGAGLTGTASSLTVGGVSAGVVVGKMVYDTFTATAAQTTFTSSVAYTASKIEVYCNGVKMRNGSDVTVTSGTSVVFATGLAVGSLVDLVYPT